MTEWMFWFIYLFINSRWIEVGLNLITNLEFLIFSDDHFASLDGRKNRTTFQSFLNFNIHSILINRINLLILEITLISMPDWFTQFNCEIFTLLIFIIIDNLDSNLSTANGFSPFVSFYCLTCSDYPRISILLLEGDNPWLLWPFHRRFCME